MGRFHRGVVREIAEMVCGLSYYSSESVGFDSFRSFIAGLNEFNLSGPAMLFSVQSETPLGSTIMERFV